MNSVTKINIDTDGRLVWTRVHREFFRDHPGEFDFRPPGKNFVEEYGKFIAKKNEKLGSAGTLGEKSSRRRESLGAKASSDLHSAIFAQIIVHSAIDVLPAESFFHSAIGLESGSAVQG
jgi:hypothetical protein